MKDVDTPTLSSETGDEDESNWSIELPIDLEPSPINLHLEDREDVIEGDWVPSNLDEEEETISIEELEYLESNSLPPDEEYD